MRARTARSSSKASSDESGRRPNRTRVVLGRIALGLIMLGGCGGAGGHGDGPVAATSSDVASSLAVHGCSGDDTSASGFDHLVSAGCNVIDRSAFHPFQTAIEIIRVIRRLYPDQFGWKQPPYEYEWEKLPIEILLGKPVTDFFEH